MVTVEAWSLEVATFASEENLLILREHTSSLRYDTSKFNQSVQVDLAKLAELVLDWETANSDKDLVVDEVVLRVDFADDVTCDLIQNWEHLLWLFCKPDCERWLLAGQVSEVDLEGLPVPLAHGLDAVFVHGLAGAAVSERLEEGLELSADEVDHFLLLDPLGEWALRVRVVVESTKIVWISFLSCPAIIVKSPIHAQCLLSEHFSFDIIFVTGVIILEGSGHSGPSLDLHAVNLVQFFLSCLPLLNIGLLLECIVDAFCIVAI